MCFIFLFYVIYIKKKKNSLQTLAEVVWWSWSMKRSKEGLLMMLAGCFVMHFWFDQYYYYYCFYYQSVKMGSVSNTTQS